MARYIGSVCRLCRREGEKLYLKAERCDTPKCAIDRRSYAPGQHGQGRTKFSEYGVQLREKQKVRRLYGILETQFRTYFKHADQKKGVTGENLLQQMEMRFDNVVFRLGLAGSRNAARQLVRHRFFTINGKKVNVPSYALKKGDVIGFVASKKDKFPVKTALESMKGKTPPSWLTFDYDKNEGTVLELSSREDVTLPINEQLIVELYSR
ncbi:30S ribosomal protein S4 [Nitrospina watsonii]|uniref:Small ribosomal subunit protein uS4 n=1 Tax=Nitrospina watsonii TaxID=1323948 RepID=A0ABM9HHB5_9BACT|nr:30S ribosomal protein S4 [Nitrospina watsonii]CAI2719415.1 30S ribosomal subunit protein S4 [Nitrospina watsonii]